MHARRFLHVMLGCAASVVVATAASLETTAGGSQPTVHVLELFTSQGCSSCPPADALLERYKARSDVIALSLPVDYWDRLGWKDTFASRENSDRQRAYARSRGDGEVYTPQIVINGRAHVIGSVASSIDRAIAGMDAEVRSARVAIAAGLQDGALVVDVGGARRAEERAAASIVVALVQDRGTVSIERGENAGRKVTYHNVVKAFRKVGSWSGSPAKLRVPLAGIDSSCCTTAVVMLQQENAGPILAASTVRIR